MLFTIIIPARYASTRLPEKAMKIIKGKPVIQWVYKACSKVKDIHEVIIATDHSNIMKAAEGFGAKAMLTSTEHQSGTDRCAEVAEQINADYIINVQGDEPFINPDHINSMINYLLVNKEVNILTLFHELPHAEVSNPNSVKLVKDKNNKVLYFSRSPIPYERNSFQEPFLKHVGIYAFKRETLMELSALKASALELAEGLEQLRWLENGLEIYGIQVPGTSISIDTQEDLEKARRYADGLSK